ncbi:MAG: 3-oxoacyl-[acyl-carrier-protein] reductase [Candidatus Eremiobacteraeota bacterium]|nr:3-oxoacyl-[acyl-carrier-protein] reductase [Candidatus Eremiobacteraeota bacterium]
MELVGKSALVTGSGGGIGKATALELAEAGADVIICDINKEAAEATAEEIFTMGRKSRAFTVDVSDAIQVQEMVKAVIADFNKIDILVNNAGITRDGLLIRMKEENWDKVLSVNLKSVYLVTKAVSRYMLKARSGRIVNIASVIGLIGNAGQANYAASKAGVIGFTKSIAREFSSRNITVNAIAPGFIRTAMTDALSDEVKSQMLESIPLGCFGEPSDVANVVHFLVSGMARYLTGQVIHVDGGMVM